MEHGTEEVCLIFDQPVRLREVCEHIRYNKNIVVEITNSGLARNFIIYRTYCHDRQSVSQPTKLEGPVLFFT